MRCTGLARLCLLVAAASPPLLAGAGPGGPPPAPEIVREAAFTVRRPAGGDWFLGHRSANKVDMARFGAGTDETFAAQVALQPVPPDATEESFRPAMAELLRQALNTGRFSLQAWRSEPDATRGPACFGYHAEAEDAGAVRFSRGRERLVIEVIGLVCRHPADPAVAVHASYSHRRYRAQRASDLAAAAARFFAGLTLAAPAPVPSAADGSTDAADDAGSWYRTGQRHEAGDGVEPDLAEAARWYRRAAEAGHADAQVDLGWSYQEGRGVAQDHREARRWFRRAADANNALGQLNLAILLDEGLGGPTDDPGAVTLYRRAAEQGVGRAQVNLAVMLAWGEGTRVDVVEALQWLHVARMSSSEHEVRQHADTVLSRLADRVTSRQARRGMARATAWLADTGWSEDAEAQSR